MANYKDIVLLSRNLCSNFDEVMPKDIDINFFVDTSTNERFMFILKFFGNDKRLPDCIYFAKASSFEEVINKSFDDMENIFKLMSESSRDNVIQQRIKDKKMFVSQHSNIVLPSYEDFIEKTKRLVKENI